MTNYYCKCLNVCLKFNKILTGIPFNDFESLTPEQQNHEFFKQLPLIVTDVYEPSKQQPSLIKTETIGSWIVYKCINCVMYSYAITNEEQSQITLINNLLTQLNDEELQNIRESMDYSPVFRIVIFGVLPSNNSDNLETSQLSEGFYSDQVLELEKQLMEHIDIRKERTEALIQNFIIEQRSALEKFINQANKDFEILKKVLSSEEIVSSEETESIEPSIYSYQCRICKSDFTDYTENTKNNFTIPTDEDTEKNAAISYMPDIEVTRHPDESAVDIPPSLDSEGLFPLDDIEATIILEDDDHSEDDLSDTDDSGSRDEGIHVPYRKSVAFARSLPIKVPAEFNPSLRLFDSRFEESKSKPNYKQKRNERPFDIAASIKALANSVHGDTIFGDLPPPRIGSRI